MISIIIPYYQKQPGILRRSLQSVARQTYCGIAAHVIVVDDESPSPAGIETKLLELPAWITIEVINQKNAGPGAARNAGLDRAPDLTTYIAFLDSDDEWSTEHLTRATSALSTGYDFYFADHYQLGQDVGAFARGGRIRPEEHPQIDGAPAGLHIYQGDLFDQTLRGNVIGTSTVVYRLEKLKKQRFHVEYTKAGEDYLFWMEAARSGAKAVFSSYPEVTYGSGVNVYSASGWGTEGHMLRIQQEIRYKKTILKIFNPNTEQKNQVKKDIERLRIYFIKDLLHRIRHRKKLSSRLLWNQTIQDPATWASTSSIIKNTIFKLKQ